MRDDEGDVRTLLDSFREEEVNDSASGIEEELEDREGVLREGCAAQTAEASDHLWCCGVEENFGGSGVQLLEDTFELGITKVIAMGVGFEDDTIGVLLVENTVQFNKTAFDVWKGQDGPITKLVGMAFLEIGGEIVAFSGSLTSHHVVGVDQIWAGRRDADD